MSVQHFKLFQIIFDTTATTVLLSPQFRMKSYMNTTSTKYFHIQFIKIQTHLLLFDNFIPIPAELLLHFKTFFSNGAQNSTAPLAVPCVF